MPFDSENFELPVVASPLPTDPVLRCLIETRRWYLENPQRWVNRICRFGSEERAVCVGVAVNDAARKFGLCDDYWDAGWVALKRALPAGHFSVGRWNDSADRTFPEVIALLDRAIELQRAVS